MLKFKTISRIAGLELLKYHQSLYKRNRMRVGIEDNRSNSKGEANRASSNYVQMR